MKEQTVDHVLLWTFALCPEAGRRWDSQGTSLMLLVGRMGHILAMLGLKERCDPMENSFSSAVRPPGLQGLSGLAFLRHPSRVPVSWQLRLR